MEKLPENSGIICHISIRDADVMKLTAALKKQRYIDFSTGRGRTIRIPYGRIAIYPGQLIGYSRVSMIVESKDDADAIKDAVKAMTN